MGKFLLALFLIGLGDCLERTSLRHEFLGFKSTYGKKYESIEEEQQRMDIFADNLHKIKKHNSRRNVSWRMKVTEFADMTEGEFKSSMLGGYIRTPVSGNHQTVERMHMEDLPTHVDWRDQGAVTEPKQQGSCGSCWAFATVENIESYAAINNVTVPELSTQEVTSCTPNPLSCGGSGGCHGSIPQLGYNYVQLFGLTTEKEYPYWSGTTGTTRQCKYDLDRRTPVASLSGYNTLPRNDILATMTHLATKGPLAIAADAAPWHLYGSGVFDGCDYSDNIGLNHAIQLVGYGTDPAEGDYWLVRNSWGARWGEDGYIRLRRESELTCGLDSTPMDGLACVGGPGTDVQHVCGQCGMLYDLSYPLGVRAFEN